MMESGPVAGMIGAGRLAGMLGLERAIGFDMGGTTAKASLITNGAPAIEEGYVIGGEASGQPMQLPVVDIVEVGAGGGSIAWCDAIGGLHVGPQSAGADPGPASYGKGSLDPVVTDADLMLGRINAERFLNGAMRLDRAAAERAVEGKLARPAAACRWRRPRSASCRSRTPRCRLRCARCRSTRASIRADRDDRVRRRRSAACGRDRARDFHSEGDRAEGAGHVLGARHADGAVAAGFRAHALSAARRARRSRPSCACSPSSRPAAGSRSRATALPERDAVFTFLADLRYVGQEHTIAIPVARPDAAQSATSRRCGDCSTPSTISATARPRPTSGSNA